MQRETNVAKTCDEGTPCLPRDATEILCVWKLPDFYHNTQRGQPRRPQGEEIGRGGRVERAVITLMFEQFVLSTLLAQHLVHIVITRSKKFANAMLKYFADNGHDMLFPRGPLAWTISISSERVTYKHISSAFVYSLSRIWSRHYQNILPH